MVILSFSMIFYGLTIVFYSLICFLWFFYEFSMAYYYHFYIVFYHFLWFLYIFSEFLWHFFGLLRVIYGYSMVFLWSTTDFLWFFMIFMILFYATNLAWKIHKPYVFSPRHKCQSLWLCEFVKFFFLKYLNSTYV